MDGSRGSKNNYYYSVVYHACVHYPMYSFQSSQYSTRDLFQGEQKRLPFAYHDKLKLDKSLVRVSRHHLLVLNVPRASVSKT